MEFKLHAPYEPTGDQPQAIKTLVDGFKEGNQFQTLLGVTGSGKTFTMANVIAALNKPTLIISHNKTLAGQLYQESVLFHEYFFHLVYSILLLSSLVQNHPLTGILPAQYPFQMSVYRLIRLSSHPVLHRKRDFTGAGYVKGRKRNKSRYGAIAWTKAGKDYCYQR